MSSRRTLIIGATSTIASEIASRCAKNGESLYLLARDAKKLESLAKSLGESVVGYASGDFGVTAANGARFDEARKALGEIDSVFIVHGALGDQIESEHSFDHAAEVFSVNLLSAVSFVVPIASYFEERGAGALVVVSSVAGDRGRPRNYTYGAAKGALSIYMQGVRSRLYGKGVRICTIRLGPVDTPMTVNHRKNALFATVDEAARAIIAARDRGPEDTYVPWYWRPIMAGVRNLPEALFQRLKFLSGR